MITNKEVQACKLSACKKDYYQIWNELLDTATKLSERWHPNSTNESDPGIVLLKVLTGIADKLNYNIDKNILEAYMPSAAQEESMRKLTEMLGYSMKYYQSAKADITISYAGTDLYDASSGFITDITFPKYLSITNADNDVNYITTEAAKFSTGSSIKVLTVPAIEGQLCQCESGATIDLTYLDSKNRYFLPENIIAENGIFITSSDEKTTWEKVDNLNTQNLNKYCYQFGYDSIKGAPYVKFPSDISSLIGDGLLISYIRTNGVNGNVSARTLTSLDYTSVTATDTSTQEEITFTENDFNVYNLSAIKNGADIETLTEAYNSYMKTTGTFETLVTCRDYMNKIYQLTDANNNPYCSNIIVSDIRDDINRSVVVAGFNEYGICYNNVSKQNENIYDIEKTGANDTPAISEFTWDTYKNSLFTGTKIKYNKSGTTTYEYYIATIAYTYDTSGNPSGWGSACSFAKFTPAETEKIDNFDLVFYPFKTLNGSYVKQNYQSSFKYTDVNLESIKADLEDCKTIAHDIKTPNNSELVCIKNYLKLNARITTTYKVNTSEQSSIRSNIFQAIYEKFNCREVDFGEEIPYDTILETIENADERIKYVILDEPELYTRFLTADGEEYTPVENKDVTTSNYQGNYYNNVLALRNILSGKVELFRYNEDFEATAQESNALKSSSNYYELTYPNGYNITELDSKCEVVISNAEYENKSITLTDNEQIIFRAPNFKTKITYPCYVNYYLILGSSGTTAAIPANFQTAASFMTGRWGDSTGTFVEKLTSENTTAVTITTETDWNNYIKNYGCLFESASPGYIVATKPTTWPASKACYYVDITKDAGFSTFVEFVKSINWGNDYYLGLYTRGYDSNNVPGRLIDSSKYKYKLKTTCQAGLYFDSFFVQNPYQDGGVWYDGLGSSANLKGISKDTEYALKANDILYINYTPSSDDDTEQEALSIKYSEGTIIRPNFELADSAEVKASGKSFSKTSGFDTSLFKDKSGNAIAGMYCLGTSEQIEIREQVKVVFPSTANSTSTYYFYFNLNNEKVVNKKINFFEDGSLSRTLEDGEYFYYTDANKLEMAYYGNGTEIVRSSTSVIISKNDTDDENITAEAIAEATNIIEIIPWIKYSFTTGTTLNIREYQYKTLSTGDTLKKLSGTTITSGQLVINNTYQQCDAAEFIYADETTGSLPTIAIDTETWEVRSRLNFNLNSSTAQVLHYTKNTVSTGVTVTAIDSVSIYGPDSTGTTQTETFTPYTADAEVWLKSNYEVIREADKVDVSITEVIDGVENPINDFKLKVFVQNDIKLEDSKVTNLSHDVGDHWSKLESNELIASSDSMSSVAALSSINVAFKAADQFALLAIYFTGETETSTDTTEKRKLLNKTSIGLIGSAETSSNKTIFIYNNKNVNDNESWWDNYSIDNAPIGTSSSKIAYYLKQGLNIIKITSPQVIYLYKSGVVSASIEKYANTSANLIISDLRIVDIRDANNFDTLGINLETIDYRATKYYSVEADRNKHIAEELLADINKIDTDHKFYYSIPIENNTAIEINTYNEEKLSDPLKWYDYNNANNKFVVSEIDSEYLSTGIQIVRNSKL